jgi:hypothetical protein
MGKTTGIYDAPGCSQWPLGSEKAGTGMELLYSLVPANPQELPALIGLASRWCQRARWQSQSLLAAALS